MAKKNLGDALNNSVMGFINTSQIEPIKEVKVAGTIQEKKTRPQVKKKESKQIIKAETKNVGLTVYTLNQAAEIIHVSKRTLFNYIKAGTFPAVKVGKSWLITEEKLRDFVEQGTEQ